MRVPSNWLIERRTMIRKGVRDMIWANLRELKEDWDSYGADPPTERAIENAKAFVDLVCSPPCGGPPVHIAPSVVGGVGITIGDARALKEGRAFYFEFCNHDEMIGVRYMKPVESCTESRGDDV